MRLPPAALPLAILSAPLAASALDSNPPEIPQVLSDNSNVCSAAQGRTSKCEVELDVPAACVDDEGASDCPVVFFFHGAGGTNDWFARTSGVHDAGMIGVYPQGENGWNTGPKDSNDCSWDDFACPSDPDEGAFVAGVISALREMGATGNVYLVGNSNGAALAHRLAANAGAADLPVKGIVTKVTQLLKSPPRSGPGELNHNQPEGGGPAVSVLNLMGVQDGLIPYGGGSSGVFGGNDNFQLMGALESMEAWAAHDGCDAQNPTVTSGVSYTTNNAPSGTATFYEYQGCPEGVIVEHYAVQEAGHSLGGALDGASIDYDLTYDFINRVEAGDGGASPTAAPVQGATCQDDPDWHGKFNVAHTCAYVADAPAQRCGWESTDGTKASEACRVACDTCPTAASPSSSPTPSCIACSNVPTPWMITKNHECATAPNWLINSKCNKESYWVNNIFCETRCQEAGYGYHATGSCCPD